MRSCFVRGAQIPSPPTPIDAGKVRSHLPPFDTYLGCFRSAFGCHLWLRDHTDHSGAPFQVLQAVLQRDCLTHTVQISTVIIYLSNGANGQALFAIFLLGKKVVRQLQKFWNKLSSVLRASVGQLWRGQAVTSGTKGSREVAPLFHHWFLFTVGVRQAQCFTSCFIQPLCKPWLLQAFWRKNSRLGSDPITCWCLSQRQLL